MPNRTVPPDAAATVMGCCSVARVCICSLHWPALSPTWNRSPCDTASCHAVAFVVRNHADMVKLLVVSPTSSVEADVGGARLIDCSPGMCWLAADVQVPAENVRSRPLPELSARVVPEPSDMVHRPDSAAASHSNVP